ncbi:unnamed protein product [Rotaria socialis]|uniref:Uncharacterized protein n=1 Tax=Rotaria socialis TaxID=392032 RepID=A0A821IJF6_9BILA|nr:unnamed protein product [Rotaria socialis]CAF4700872.1 unnamed protein product [Rotaria socialis]
MQAGEGNLAKNDDDDDLTKVIVGDDKLFLDGVPDLCECVPSSVDYTPSPSSLGASDGRYFEVNVLLREESAVEQQSHTTQQQHRSSLYDNRKYRIHFGTRPGSYAPERLSYEKCQKRHEKLIDLLNQIHAKLDDLRMKQFLFEILHSSAISTTETWAIEPYACISFGSCPLETVEGVAAIVGRILRQDGIGIFHDGCDYQDHLLGQFVDTSYYIHRFFVISRSDHSQNLSISNDDAREMMAAIGVVYPKLSGQFGKSNETIELHDFEDYYKAEIIEDLNQIISNVSSDQNRSYRIEERKVNSRLLLKDEYSGAIKEAGFELLALFIDAAHLHNTLYPSTP